MDMHRKEKVIKWKGIPIVNTGPGLRVGTRYLSSTPVTPIEFSHSQTSVPSRSMARIP